MTELGNNLLSCTFVLTSGYRTKLCYQIVEMFGKMVRGTDQGQVCLRAEKRFPSQVLLPTYLLVGPL